MSALPTLCQSFVKAFESSRRRNMVGNSFREEFRLGTLPEIRSRDCELCKLICEAIDQYRRAEPYRRFDTEYLTFRCPEEDVISFSFEHVSDPNTPAGGLYTPEFVKDESVMVSKLRRIGLAFGSQSLPRLKELNIDHGRLSGLLQEKLDALVDFGMVARWLDHCATSHQKDGGCLLPVGDPVASIFPGLQVLRLVDVSDGQMCLVETADRVPHYIALSYVWGEVTNFRLTRANRPALMAHGALSRVWMSLPATIRDAITLTQKLGARYLWVDSLCLLQNDSDDLDRGVAVMDHIYERAWLTVVAACGHDANAGLPGVQPGSRTEQQLVREVNPGLFVGAFIAPSHLLQTSVYNTRAWTFQESALSRRVLSFIDNKVSFRCRESEFMEIFGDTPDPITTVRYENKRVELSKRSKRDVVSWRYACQLYASHIGIYTSRSLTNQVDTLRAMAGVMRRDSELMQSDMLEGLPVRLLEPFLTFRGRNLRRRREFPSYSWAGWIGGVETSVENKVTNDAWIIWYKTCPIASVVVSGPNSQKFSIQKTWDQTTRVFGVDSDDDPERLQRREQAMAAFKSLLPGELLRYTPSLKSKHGGSGLQYPLLLFWTTAVFLKLSNVDVFSQSANLVGSDGAVCGQVQFNGYEETTFFDENELFEFVLISKNSSWDLIEAMLIEWAEAGVAERRGIARIENGYTNSRKVLIQSFAPGPVWKEVVLR